MALDQATTHLLNEMAKMGGKPMSECTPEEARAMSPGAEMYGEGPKMAEEKELKIAVEGGEIELMTLKPSNDPQAIIVYYHGGGWVLSDIYAFKALGQKMAKQTNSTVVLVNYRKAPEHQFPVPINDSYTALKWVEEHKAELASEEAPLIVAGDSAGGNISAVMCLKSKREKGPEIHMQALIYPVTANDFTRPSYIDPQNQLILDKPLMEWFWNHYVPNLSDRLNSEVSPLYATDLEGLPQAVVLTAGHDVLRDEGEEYATKLMKAGVPVTFERFADQTHGFFSFVNILPGSDRGIEFISKTIVNALPVKEEAVA